MKIRSRFLFALSSAAALCSWSSGIAYAQTIPAAADPVKAADRFQAQGLSHKQDEPIAEAPEKKAGESMGDERFVLGGIRIEGMTVYKPEIFTPLYKDMIGKSVSVDEVRDLTAKITNRYRKDGYSLAIAYLPGQTVEDNETLLIHVDEGRIGIVKFQGEQPPEDFYNLTMQYVNKIRAMKPVRQEPLERYLLMINDLPGNTARAVLRPSAEDPGATDLFIYYDHKAFDALVATDNRGSGYLGPWQNSASVGTNGILGLNEHITLRGVATSPFSELQYTDLQYEQPVGTHGTRLQTTVSYANTRPGETLKRFRVRGDSTDVMVRAFHPLLRSRLQNLYARAAVDVRNSATDVSNINISDDRVRSVRLGLSYDTVNDEGGVTIVDTEISRGIAGLGATKDGADRSVSNGDHAYTKITMDISRTQMLPADFSLFVSGSGQYSLNSLLSSEQYLLGGPAYGTAYDPGELTGDHGLAGKMELRYGQALDGELVRRYQLYGYYDIGAVWRKHPLGTLDARDSLTSIGTGVRTDFARNVTGILEIAVPLTHNPSTNPDNTARIFGGLTAKY